MITETKRLNWKSVAMAAVGTLFMTLAVLLPAESQSSSSDYAILIVGDEGTAEMLREEKVLINEMAVRIRQQTPEQRLPIYSYHFNKERERAYCENKLNVLSEDLLFVGIVKLKDKVPLKVVYRVDRITNPARAAKDILVRAEEILAEASPQPTVSESPAPVNTPATVTNRGFRVQLGSFAKLEFAQKKVADANRAALKVAVVELDGPDGDTLYKVLSPVFSERTDADAMLAKFHEAGFEEAFLTRVSE
ncbi:MAG: SPOR domain-containing protein [Vulcanimicrobiota bacterium]